MSINANYNGRQPNKSVFVKEFYAGTEVPLWTTTLHINNLVIVPASNQITSLYIPGNLYVDGLIVNPSDENLKEDIKEITREKTDKLMNIRPTQFKLKSEKNITINNNANVLHYGFIAQEFEQQFPELVTMKPDKTMKNVKAINYLEIIPFLVHKIQLMQEEINSVNKRLEEACEMHNKEKIKTE